MINKNLPCHWYVRYHLFCSFMQISPFNFNTCAFLYYSRLQAKGNDIRESSLHRVREMTQTTGFKNRYEVLIFLCQPLCCLGISCLRDFRVHFCITVEVQVMSSSIPYLFFWWNFYPAGSSKQRMHIYGFYSRKDEVVVLSIIFCIFQSLCAY